MRKLEYVPTTHYIIIIDFTNAHLSSLQQKDQRLKTQDEQLKGNTNVNASSDSDLGGGDVDSKIRLLRKEVMGKIRDLEDEIQEIKYRLRI